MTIVLQCFNKQQVVATPVCRKGIRCQQGSKPVGIGSPSAIQSSLGPIVVLVYQVSFDSHVLDYFGDHPGSLSCTLSIQVIV
jgi:hypothetical protein